MKFFRIAFLGLMLVFSGSVYAATCPVDNSSVTETGNATSVCPTGFVFYIFEGACVAQSVIDADEAACADSLIANGSIDGTWTCQNGCTSVTTCNGGFINCGGSCQAPVTPAACLPGQQITNVNQCTGARTCVDIAQSFITKFVGGTTTDELEESTLFQDDNGNIAINSLTPGGNQLFVDGRLEVADTFYITNSSTSTKEAEFFVNTNTELVIDVEDTTSGFPNPNEYSLKVFDSNAIPLTAEVDGKVGADGYCNQLGDQCVIVNDDGTVDDPNGDPIGGGFWDEVSTGTIYYNDNSGARSGGPNVGIGVTGPSLPLQVNGKVGADQFCDQAGANCITPGGGGLSPWDDGSDAGGSFIYYNTGGGISGVRVGIGTTVPAAGSRLHVDGNIYVSNGGFIYHSSDKNKKYNIKPLQNVLDQIDRLRGVSFNWRNSGKSSIGFIAQELEQVFPGLVSGEDGEKRVAYTNLTAVLVEGIKELKAENEALEARIKALEAASK